MLGLSRTARMVLTATQAGRCSLPMSPCSTSPGLRIQRPPHTAKTDTATPNKGKADAHGGNMHPHTGKKRNLTTLTQMLSIKVLIYFNVQNTTRIMFSLIFLNLFSASKACLITAHNSKENNPQLKRKTNSKSRY